MKRTAILGLALVLALPALGGETRRYLVALREGMRESARTAGVTPRNVRHLEAAGTFAADLTPEEAAAMRRSPDVRVVEPVVERHAFDVPRTIGAQTIPNGIAMVRAPLAWSARNVTDVNVVVIDTGVDYRHPELRAAWRGGYDFVAGDNDPLDDNGHGTHVSGIILAKNDAQGIVGVAPGMRLWGLKVLNATGKGKNEDLIRAVEWVGAKKKIERGLWIINLSLGGSEASDLEREAFARIAGEGVLVVASSGNSSTTAVPAPVQYPAAYSSVIAVGAVNEAQKVASFSCQGPELDFVAPGTAVLSTVRVGTDSIAYFVNGAATTTTFAVEGSRKGLVTGEYVYCGLGKEGEITPGKVHGKIALIRRGEIPFAEKAKRAKENGAAAVVIFNNDTSGMRWTMLSDADPSSHTYEWPLTVAMSQTTGEALVAKGGGTLTIAYVDDDYGEKSGTSMAAPHVAGAAAFLWSLAPSAAPAAVLNALTTTAIDLGTAGPDPVYGAGLVDVEAAARLLAPAQFLPPPPIPGAPSTGRRMGKR
ncbi:MAG TPA: S8 family serine peptidase [Thermoanaerobaculia bacterium]|nr:S8 family serine peptidase [Thermoanaerobaculia bacterium]